MIVFLKFQVAGLYRNFEQPLCYLYQTNTHYVMNTLVEWIRKLKKINLIVSVFVHDMGTGNIALRKLLLQTYGINDTDIMIDDLTVILLHFHLKPTLNLPSLLVWTEFLRAIVWEKVKLREKKFESLLMKSLLMLSNNIPTLIFSAWVNPLYTARRKVNAIRLWVKCAAHKKQNYMNPVIKLSAAELNQFAATTLISLHTQKRLCFQGHQNVGNFHTNNSYWLKWHKNQHLWLAQRLRR